MSKLYEIYGLFDPLTDELRYIGKANNAARRLEGHLRDATRRKMHLYNWISKLVREGLVPVCRVLCTTDNWEFEERRLIFENRLTGRLLNIADGGNAPKTTCASCRAGARAALAKRPKNIMRMYRRIECNIRLFKKRLPSAVEKNEAFLARFKKWVDEFRRNGRLAIFDARIGEYLEGRC